MMNNIKPKHVVFFIGLMVSVFVLNFFLTEIDKVNALNSDIAKNEVKIAKYETERLNNTIIPTSTTKPTQTPQKVEIATNKENGLTLIAKKYKNSPLASKLDLFFMPELSKDDSYILIGISVAETRLGADKSAQTYFNGFNYFCDRKNKTGKQDCGFVGAKANWEYSVPRLAKLIHAGYISKLQTYSKEEIESVFVGKGKYCVSGCEHFTNNVYSTYLTLKNNENN